MVGDEAPTPDHAAVPVERRPQSDIFGDEDDDLVDGSVPDAARKSRIESAQRSLKQLIEVMSTPAHMAKYPLPDITHYLSPANDSISGALDSLRAVDAATSAFYNEHRALVAPIWPVIKAVFSASGSSAGARPSSHCVLMLPAGAEQAFSTSGRLDSPLRNSMAPSTLEKLTGASSLRDVRCCAVVQQYLTYQKDYTMSELVDKCMAHIENHQGAPNHPS